MTFLYELVLGALQFEPWYLIMLNNFPTFQVPVRLSTIHYKLLPSHASNLFIDLAYFHLELSAIAVKGMLPYLLETSGENAENLALKEREIEDEHIAAQDTVFRLVICQNNFSPVKGNCVVAGTLASMCIKLKIES